MPTAISMEKSTYLSSLGLKDHPKFVKEIQILLALFQSKIIIRTKQSWNPLPNTTRRLNSRNTHLYNCSQMYKAWNSLLNFYTLRLYIHERTDQYLLEEITFISIDTSDFLSERKISPFPKWCKWIFQDSCQKIFTPASLWNFTEILNLNSCALTVRLDKEQSYWGNIYIRSCRSLWT